MSPTVVDEELLIPSDTLDLLMEQFQTLGGDRSPDEGLSSETLLSLNLTASEVGGVWESFSQFCRPSHIPFSIS